MRLRLFLQDHDSYHPLLYDIVKKIVKKIVNSDYLNVISVLLRPQLAKIWDQDRLRPRREILQPRRDWRASRDQVETESVTDE